MRQKGKRAPLESKNADPGVRKQRETGGPEPESPGFDKKLDGPNRPST